MFRLIVLLIPSLLFCAELSKEICLEFKPSLKPAPAKINAAEKFVPRGFIAEDSALQKKTVMDSLFAHEYMQHNEIDLEELNVLIERYFSKKYQEEKLLSALNVPNEEKILKSYYLDNLEKYRIADTIDIYQLFFKTEQSAKQFVKKHPKITKTAEYTSELFKKMPKIRVSALTNEYKLNLMRHDENVTTGPVEIPGGYFEVMFYNNRIEGKSITFQQARNEVLRDVIAKKQQDIIDKKFEELKLKLLQ